MDSLTKSDVFFFITGAAVLLVTFLVVVTILYVLTVVREVRAFLRWVHGEAQLLSGDVAELREKLSKRGAVLATITAFIAGLLGLRNVKRK